MKILILGASHTQVDAIRFLIDRGHEVHCCSYNKHDVAELVCNYYVPIDITDIEGIKNYAEHNNICLVYSVGSDIAIPTAMIVSEKLGLPHYISSETALICQNKAKMRSCLGKDFMGNVEFSVGKTFEEIESFKNFPAMVKPTDSQGQRGCSEVHNKDEMHDAFENAVVYSRSKTVIVEQLISGDEVSCNAFFKNGSPVVSFISDRVSFDDLPGGIIKKHLIPSKFTNSETETRILSLVSRAAQKLCINNGPGYFQIKVQEGVPYIIEVAPRLDGCHMWRLIKEYSGIDLLELTLNTLVGLPMSQTRFELEFFTLPPNAVFERNLFDGIEKVNPFWYYADGDTVKKVNGYMEKCGYHIKKW